MRPSVPDVQITDSQDTEFAAYQAVAPQAVLGLICGLLAPFALIDPAFWFVPPLGILLNWWALRRIKNDPAALTGRKLAIMGLTLSLLLAVAAPVDWVVYRHLVADEARQFSSLWFKYLAQGEPQKAHQLTKMPQSRLPLDDNQLWDFYRNTSPNGDRKKRASNREELEGYVAQPLVRTLLALGPKAQVRFYQTAAQVADEREDVVELLYAVTYEEGNEKKSFFVFVQAVRGKLSKDKNQAGWRLTQTSGGIKPEGWQANAK
jgi:hypothetical protein